LQAGAGTGIGNALANTMVTTVTTGVSMNGMGGNDTIQGGTGADTLEGGAGADSMAGGAGADVFVFTKGDANNDSVADFSHAQAEQLKFVGYGAGSTLTQLDPILHPNDWTITDGVDHSQETIHLTNHPALVGSDYLFA
jgi:Ca2+-binding RTX toxin-like protein